MERKAFDRILEKYGKNVSGMLAVAFRDLETGDFYGYQAEQPVPCASTYKVFTLMELYRRSRLGEFSLDDRVSLRTGDKTVGTGLLNDMSQGLNPTLRDCAKLMMYISDNTAADILYRLVTAASIREHILKPLGLSSTRVDFTCRDMIGLYYGTSVVPGENSDAYFNRNQVKNPGNPYFACQSPENVQTTAADMATALEAIYRAAAAGEKEAKEMLEIMAGCQTNSRIPLYLPQTATCCHKTGSLDRVTNDVGIVCTPAGSYILCMFYNGNLAAPEEYAKNHGRVLSDKMLAEISGELYRAYTEAKNAPLDKNPRSEYT